MQRMLGMPEEWRNGRPLIVGFIGFSQSGKSSRINNIMKLTDHYIASKVFTRIYEKGTQHSRHFLPFTSIIKGRSIDTVLITIDYTGHDHSATYLFTEKILELLNEDSLHIIRGTLLNEILNIARELVGELVSSEGEGISRGLLLRLIESPIPRYGELKEYFDPYSEICKSIKGVSCRSSEITYLVESVVQTIREVRKNRVSFTDLNKIICTLEATSDSKDVCLNIGKANSVEIVVDKVEGYLKRLIITAPLLTYLLIGLLIESNTLFILVPASIRSYLEQLKTLLLVENDPADYHYFMTSFRTLAWAGENIHSILTDTILHVIRGEREDVRDNVPEIVKACVDKVAGDEASRLNLPADSKQVLVKVSPFISINAYKEFLRCVSNDLDGIDAEFLEERLNRVLTRIILEKYQVGLLENILRLIGHLIEIGVKPLLNTIVIDYTYMDKTSKLFREVVSESLSGNLFDLERDTPALSGIYGLIDKVFRKNNAELKIYVIPSFMRNGETTPLEYVMLVCLLEDKLASFKIIDKDTGRSRELTCLELFRKTTIV
ncbi:MAG: hypothetical protein QW387_01985 [Desulfurococcus sp.]|uniref:hypothetical protein n=1 Tax=Desulfurococcus sp. TaxID=51678 RepID=UPI00315E1984